jgi:predicted nucleic acid-binding protein
MTFAAIPSNSSIYLDANVLVYHLTAHPIYGQASTNLIHRVELGEISAFAATHVMSEVVHKLMLIEAAKTFGWPLAGTLKRLQRNPDLIQQLTLFRKAIHDLVLTGMRVLAIPPNLLDDAAAISQQFGLFSNDALSVAMMRQHNLVLLASADPDFDRVSWLTRISPT